MNISKIMTQVAWIVGYWVIGVCLMVLISSVFIFTNAYLDTIIPNLKYIVEFILLPIGVGWVVVTDNTREKKDEQI